MSPRELQHLISMIEDKYENENHPSLAQTLTSIQQHIELSDHQLVFRYLKNQQGPPTGQISRVVSKQLFTHLTNTQSTTLADVLTNATDMFNCTPEELSDDMFCRYLRN